MSATDLLDQKISVPSDMRTAEWSMVPQWIRERSFYMAGVPQPDILDAFRAEVKSIVDGTSSVEESRKELEQLLADIGYKPLPGQEGTIKDLMSERRISIALSTNVSILHGWAQKERGLQRGAEIAFPVWELVRVASRQVPREWPARFVVAGGMITEDGRMMAPKNSDVWKDLGSRESFPDALGVDYPPFAWGSGMGWQAVPRDEALKLGVIDDKWQPMRRRPISSPNAALECTPRVSEPALREAISERMRGLAKWEGEKLVFTDPNGTRPMTAEDLADVWRRGMPEAFSSLPGGGLMQRESFLQWVADSSFYWNAGRPAARLGAKNVWEDFLRLLMRLLPTGRERQPLFRSLTWNSNEAFSAFLEKMRRSGYAVRDEVPAESWTASMQAARKYRGQGRYAVMLTLPGGHSAARDIAPLVRELQQVIAQKESPQGKLAVTDDEVMMPVWAGLRIRRMGEVKETAQGKEVEIELEEAR